MVVGDLWWEEITPFLGYLERRAPATTRTCGPGFAARFAGLLHYPRDSIGLVLREYLAASEHLSLGRTHGGQRNSGRQAVV